MNNSNIKNLETRMNDLRNQWKEQNDLEFDHESNCKCPTCEQELPQEQVTEIATKFNLEKSKLLETIQKNGVEAKEKEEGIKEEKESIQSEIDKLNEQIDQKRQDVEKVETKRQEDEKNNKPLYENPDYHKLHD